MVGLRQFVENRPLTTILCAYAALGAVVLSMAHVGIVGYGVVVVIPAAAVLATLMGGLIGAVSMVLYPPDEVEG